MTETNDTPDDTKAADGETEVGSTEANPTPKEPAATDKDAAPDRFWLWALAIAVVVSAELYVYGHAGTVTVCVGTDKIVDFARRGETRTVESYRKIPHCSERSNLGMWSKRDEVSKDALKSACQAATRGSSAELQHCIRKDGSWTRRVYEEQIAPWDPRLYRRLLWID